MLKDGDVFLEPTSLRESDGAHNADEYIKVTIEGGVPNEISWHDTPNVKQVVASVGCSVTRPVRVGKSRGRCCNLLTRKRVSLVPLAF